MTWAKLFNLYTLFASIWPEKYLLLAFDDILIRIRFTKGSPIFNNSKVYASTCTKLAQVLNL